MPYDDAQLRDESVPATPAPRQADADPKPRERDAPDRRKPNEPKRDDDQRQGKAEAEDDKKSDDKGGGDGKQGGKQKRRSPLVWIILAVVIVAAAIGGVIWWLSVKDEATTDDAYTDGRAISITPKVSGYVTELAVNDNQRVHAGDLIIQIDPRDYITARDQARANLEIAQAQKKGSEFGAAIAAKNFPARLAQAQAQLGQAKAQLFQAQTDYSRQHGIARAATTQQAVDSSTADLPERPGQRRRRPRRRCSRRCRCSRTSSSPTSR